MRENMSNEVKTLIRDVIDRMVVPLLAAAEQSSGGGGGEGSSGGAAFSGAGGGSGGGAAQHRRNGSGLPLPPTPAIHPAQQEAEMAEKLASLSHSSFMQVFVQ